MNARQRNELVEALLACANVSSRHSRDTIVADLREGIRNGVQRNSADHEDVTNIIRACLNYANGLEELVAIVRGYEHDSVAMQDVDRLLLHLFDFQIEEEQLGLRVLVIVGDVDTPLDRLLKFYRELLPRDIAPQGEPLGLFAMLSHLWNLSCLPNALTRQRTFPIVDFATQLALAAGGRRVAGELRSWADEAQKHLYQPADTDPTAPTPVAMGATAADGHRLMVLASVLASLYPSVEGSGELVAAARLNPVSIQFRDLALPNWQNILAEAARRDRVKALVDSALAAHPRHPWLTLARRELRQAEQPASRVLAPPPSQPKATGIVTPSAGLWPRDVSFLELALVRARPVVRVRNAEGQPTTTAFLTHGNLLIVPNHSIPTVEYARQVTVEFNFQRTAGQLYAVSEELRLAPEEAFATSQENMWTAVRVQGDPNARWGALDLDSAEPKLGDPVSLIHHAFGGPKQVEVLTGVVQALNATRLQYTFTVKQPGSGGAPLFDGDWNVIGMHQSAGWLANLNGLERQTVFCREGVRINSIVDGLKAAGLYVDPESR